VCGTCASVPRVLSTERPEESAGTPSVGADPEPSMASVNVPLDAVLGAGMVIAPPKLFELGNANVAPLLGVRLNGA
jgi:hypothetical protein